ncbi:hypothetical protein EVAR_88609_1 [Eumeta japonica]|uniref:Uncharacterized protein n=1 Tax=Eumeta variegata TaxID=151549 RepID=A0A4C2A671_EUMVA|nr:hypothetical protein EVAR_88609_1 [Eumeta japonica]
MLTKNRSSTRSEPYLEHNRRYGFLKYIMHIGALRSPIAVHLSPPSYKHNLKEPKRVATESADGARADRRLRRRGPRGVPLTYGLVMYRNASITHEYSIQNIHTCAHRDTTGGHIGVSQSYKYFTENIKPEYYTRNYFSFRKRKAAGRLIGALGMLLNSSIEIKSERSSLRAGNNLESDPVAPARFAYS